MNCKWTAYSEQNSMRRENACHAMDFVLPIAVSQRPVLPNQITFTNPNIVCPAYLLPCPHLHSTLSARAPSPLEKRGCKYHPRFQCLFNTCVVAACCCMVRPRRPVRRQLTCGGELILHLLLSLKQYLGFPSLACP